MDGQKLSADPRAKVGKIISGGNDLDLTTLSQAQLLGLEFVLLM